MTEIINYPSVFFMATVLSNNPEQKLPKIRRDIPFLFRLPLTLLFSYKAIL